MMKNTARVLWALFLCAAIFPVRTSGAENPTEQALSLLKQMSEALKAHEGFSAGYQVTDERNVPQLGKVAVEKTGDLLLQRSRRLKNHITILNKADQTIYFDGHNITLADNNKKVYGQIPSEGNIALALETAMDPYGFILPLADFVTDNVNEDLTANVREAKSLPDEMIDGKNYRHLYFVQNTIDWEIWISPETFFPKKIAIIYKQEKDKPKYMVMFQEFQAKADFADSDFAFIPSQGWDKVPVLKKDEENPVAKTSKSETK